VFGYWHVAHRPFALTALLAVLVHVMVDGEQLHSGHRQGNQVVKGSG